MFCSLTSGDHLILACGQWRHCGSVQKWRNYNLLNKKEKGGGQSSFENIKWDFKLKGKYLGEMINHSLLSDVLLTLTL